MGKPYQAATIFGAPTVSRRIILIAAQPFVPYMIMKKDMVQKLRIFKSTTIETMKTEIKKAGQKQRARILYLEVADTISEDNVFKAIKSEIGRTPIKKVLFDYKGIIKAYIRSYFRPKK